MSKFNPREHRPLWLEDSGLNTSQISDAIEPAARLLEEAGVTPEEAHAEMIALLEAGNDDGLYECAWSRAERAITADRPESAVMALG
jgi:hypothetical protein